MPRANSLNRNSGYIEAGFRANAVLPASQVEPFLKSLLQQNFRARTSEQFTQASLDYLHVRCSAAELNGVSSEAADSILSSVRQWSAKQDNDLTLLVCDYVCQQEIIHCCLPIAPQTGKKPRIPPLRTVIAD